MSGDHHLKVPVWIWGAACQLARYAMGHAAAREGAGRGARWSAKFEQDRIDHVRWHIVKKLRDKGVKFTDGEVFRVAAARLPSGAKCSAGVVRRSYYRVQRRMKSEPWRYYLPTHVRAPVSGL